MTPDPVAAPAWKPGPPPLDVDGRYDSEDVYGDPHLVHVYRGDPFGDDGALLPRRFLRTLRCHFPIPPSPPPESETR